MSPQSKIRVGVLRGGASPEYEKSLKTGGSILSHLPEEKYKPVDMLITKDGIWHIHGLPATKSRVKEAVDVIFNALHGTYGIDGHVHNILGNLSVPHTGSNFLDSTMGLSEVATRDQVKSLGLKTPLEVIIPAYDAEDQSNADELVPSGVEGFVSRAAQRVFEKISPPWVVKPNHSNLVTGAFIAKSRSELERSIRKIIERGSGVLVEEYIKGRKAISGVIDNFRGEESYSLLPIEIEGEKMVGPHNLSQSEKEAIQKQSQDIHRQLGLKQYSQVNFIVSPKRGVYVLGVKALPQLAEASSFCQSLEEVGADLPEFLDHIVSLTVNQAR